MSTTVAYDVDAVRARFSALQRPLAFFDGPGGTQCPDAVIDAIAGYLRESNANVGAPYETSRRTDALIAHARERAAAFLGCSDDPRGSHDLPHLLTKTRPSIESPYLPHPLTKTRPSIESPYLPPPASQDPAVD